jgi:hypothetical protein
VRAVITYLDTVNQVAKDLAVAKLSVPFEELISSTLSELVSEEGLGDEENPKARTF